MRGQPLISNLKEGTEMNREQAQAFTAFMNTLGNDALASIEALNNIGMYIENEIDGDEKEYIDDDLMCSISVMVADTEEWLDDNTADITIARSERELDETLRSLE